MNKLDYIERIDNYLSFRLSEQEAKNLEQEAAGNPELAAFIENLRAERALIIQLKSLELNDRMKQWDKEMALKSSERVKNRRWLLAGLLALVGMGGAIYWQLNRIPSSAPVNTPEKTKPAEQQKTDTIAEIKPPSVPPIPPTEKPQKKQKTPDYITLAQAAQEIPDEYLRSGSNPEMPALDSAKWALADSKYTKVIILLQPLMQNNPAMEEQELLAHAYFKERAWKEAAVLFEQLAATGFRPYAERAEWHALLCYVAMGPSGKPMAKKVLKKIEAKPTHVYRSKAQYLANTIHI